MLYYMVLGNKSDGITPSADMCSRIEYLRYLLSVVDEPATVILSGANGEAELMHKHLASVMPEELLHKHTIITDVFSLNTIQSILYLKEHNIQYATVITSDYHTDRVKCIVYKLKCNCRVIGAPTDNSLLWKSFWECIFYILTAVLPINICLRLSKIRKYFI